MVVINDLGQSYKVGNTLEDKLNTLYRERNQYEMLEFLVANDKNKQTQVGRRNSMGTLLDKHVKRESMARHIRMNTDPAVRTENMSRELTEVKEMLKQLMTHDPNLEVRKASFS